MDCYERETSVGGAWNLRHGRTPGAVSTHLVTSRPCTQFPDFPMPDDWPDYPRHSQVLAYLERYTDHFGLREHIWFGTEVVRVEPVGSEPTGVRAGRWDVTIKGQRGGAARIMRYAAVVVANGHTSTPHMPSYEGLSSFQGKVLHSSACWDPAQLRGKRVLVVGAGNAGCDLAVSAAQTAATCWHSSRRGYWYAPKYLLGRPLDQWALRVQTMHLPQWLRRSVIHRALRMTVGDQTRFGLAAPDHPFGATHPIVNSSLIYQVGHGGIIPVPDVARFGRHEVTLTDGTVLEPDVVVCATGYRASFDFLTPEVLGAGRAGQPSLRWYLLARDHPTLAVVGLVQPDSQLFACAHWQSVLMAQWLRALDNAPDRAAEFWAKHGDADTQRYLHGPVVDSPRHRFEVNHLVYLRALEQAINELEAVR